MWGGGEAGITMGPSNCSSKSGESVTRSSGLSAGGGADCGDVTGGETGEPGDGAPFAVASLTDVSDGSERAGGGESATF